MYDSPTGQKRSIFELLSGNMETIEIIKEINRLSINERMLIIEKIVRSIRENETRNDMIIAAEALSDDYKNDKELTIFSQLDCEDFYETR